jgi:AcrR family transcriptional regulator
MTQDEQPAVGRPDRPRLTKDRILDEAVRLVERDGPRALSMRKLGERLGVTGMSLYRHISNREALMDALVDRIVDAMLERPDVRPRDDDDWRGFLTRLAHGVRQIALEQPSLFPLVATHPPSAPWLRPPLRSLRWVEAFLAGLLNRGFGDEGAVAAYRAFSSFLLGHLLLEVSARGVTTGPVDEPAPAAQAPSEVRATLDGHPALERLQPQLAEDHAESEFQASLTSLLDRLEHFNAIPQERAT